MKIKFLICAEIVSVPIFFSIGYLLGKKHTPKINNNAGVLRIDNSDPDIHNALFLELNIPVEYVKNMNEVSFKVLNENYIRN